MKVLVANAENTADLIPPRPFNSWIEYWESKKGKLDERLLHFCRAEDCHRTCRRSELDGSHVKKVNDRTGRMYIIPLCDSCNHREDVFEVDDDFLVPVF